MRHVPHGRHACKVHRPILSVQNQLGDRQPGLQRARWERTRVNATDGRAQERPANGTQPGSNVTNAIDAQLETA